jgi:hypothetical protein
MAGSPMSDLPNCGAAFVSFADLDRKGTFIRWNEDRTEATVGITTHYGPLDATGYAIKLRKRAGQWVAVECRMEWIS